MTEPEVIEIQYERGHSVSEDGPSIVLAATCLAGILGVIAIVCVLNFDLFR